MTEHRAYLINDDDRITSFRAFICDSDTDATVWAHQLIDGHDVELWSGERLVIRLTHEKKNEIAT